MLNVVFSAICMLFIMAVMVYEGNKMLLSFTPPMEYLAITATPENIKPGETLSVKIKVKRHRFCRVNLDTFMIHKDSRDVVYRKSVAGGASELGIANVNLNHVVPLDAPPGEYEFLSRGFYDCYEGMHVLSFPVVKFAVVR